jgi:hypothetical protein
LQPDIGGPAYDEIIEMHECPILADFVAKVVDGSRE